MQEEVVCKINIPETDTSFHRWYKSKYEKDIEMTYSEIYDVVKSEKDENLLCEIKEYHKDFESFWKKRADYPLNIKISAD